MCAATTADAGAADGDDGDMTLMRILMITTMMTIITGMWTGYTCGMFVEAIIGLIVLVTTDWEYQVQRVSWKVLFQLIS